VDLAAGVAPARLRRAASARRPEPGRARLLRPSYESSYRRALDAFVRAIDGGPARPASARDGLRGLGVLLAAEESARTGATVPVDDGGR